MTTRRRITQRIESFAHHISAAIFWMRRGCGPLQAWHKAKNTL